MNDPYFIEPWLDENNEHFCPKVFIAINAWQDIFGNKDEDRAKINVKERLIKWLKDHDKWINDNYVYLDEQDIEDISIIITPDSMKNDEDKLILPDDFFQK